MNLHKIANYFYPSKILDIGANIGQFHELTKNTYPEAFIFSIEANPECEQYLKEITSDYYIGLLAKDNLEYNFFSKKDNPIGTGNSIYKELTHHYSDDKLKILKQTGVKLDDLFEKTLEFDLIKIDTQGSELDIIAGGINLCYKAKGILLEVSITQYNEGAPLYQEVIDFMNSIGFIQVDILDELYIPDVVHQQDILFLNKLFLD